MPTYQEFLQQIDRARLTIREFAELTGMNRISLSNYAKKNQIPGHLAIIVTLIGEMGERKIDFRSLLKTIQVLPKKPRGAGIGKFGGDRQNRLF